ncbi:MAG: hypothetical protein LBG80_08490 [Bacteroidales bacterium]|jgi:hypothetical protein|nr:hypothetical protein [Bacteroidales bacterium]
MKSELIIDKEIFAEKLSEQIKLGKILLERNINSIDDLESLKKDSKDWSDYNGELLKRSFSIPDNEYKNEYKKSVLGWGVLGNKSFTEKVKECKNNIQKRINCLESIHKRIDLMQVT